VNGPQLHAFASEMYPICRSITGAGVRDTLRRVGKHIPLKIHEVPSGTQVFDWEVPLEWNIEDAYVLDPQGRRVVDFAEHNLHLVSYSEPLDRKLTLQELKPHLHAHKSNPDWIPYRTSYYKRNWGFCMRGRDLDALGDGDYRVRIDSSLARGSLSYGEFFLPGRAREEVLLFTHVCHPSLANDNTSGIAIATALASWLAKEPRRYSYRIVFAPGTIGSLCWLKRNESRLSAVRHGLVLGLLADSASLTYKRSRRGTAEIDKIVPYALASLDPAARTISFEPYGYDERQLCSPGFDLPVGRLTRSVNDGYPEYHSSADDLSLITPAQLEASLLACQRICEIVEADRRYINLSPKGEARLGKRGLYGATGGNSPAVREHAMLWMLNQSDGSQSVLDIAQTSERPFDVLAGAALELEKAGLMRAVANAEEGAREFRKVVTKKSKARPKAGKRRKK
jgi:aminopeptidase-like protein